MEFPQNESFEHFTLKEIGKLYLKHNQLCGFIADEIETETFGIAEIAEEQFDVRLSSNIIYKKRTDCFGMKATYGGEVTIKSAEAKASLSDFRNGYCIGGEYNYIIAPQNIIPVEELPPFMGLIEIDFDHFYYRGDRLKSGYKSVKQAKRIKLPEKKKKKYVEKMKWRMLYKLTEKQRKNSWLYRTRLKREYGDYFKEQ